MDVQAALSFYPLCLLKKLQAERQNIHPCSRNDGHKLALEWATPIDHHYLVIYSDSLDVLQAIEQRQSLNRPNLLRDLLSSHEVVTFSPSGFRNPLLSLHKLTLLFHDCNQSAAS